MEPYPIAIFVKRPLVGQVKTRLAPAIGAESATSLYTAMLHDTVTVATQFAARAGLILYEGDEPRSWLPKLPTGWGMAAQSEGDLGQRLAAAVATAAERDLLPLLILGSDSPDLPESLLEGAQRALRDHELVLGPTADGGVWCIGLRAEQPELFVDIPWSQPETGAALRNRARELGLNWVDLDPWQDVDGPEDLLDLATRLAASSSTGAAHTRRWLAAHEGPWRTPSTSVGLE